MDFNSSKNVENNVKKSKVLKILIAFFVFFLLATYFVYSYYIKNSMQENLKKEFFSHLANHDLDFFVEDNLYTKIAERMEKENYDSSTQFKLSTTMQNNMFSQLDLSKFEIAHQWIKNNQEDKNYHEISARYAGNHVLTASSISDSNQFAIKSDEIVNKYVGINHTNLQNISNKIADKTIDFSPLKKLKNFAIDREKVQWSKTFKDTALERYAKIIMDNISASDFSKKENIIVTLDSEQIDAIEYTVSLSSDEVKTILNKFSETLENDDEIIPNLVVSQVKKFEEEGITEYTDNDNATEISGEENNFNTSMEIWGEGQPIESTTSDEQTTSNTTSENVMQVPSTAETETNTINQVPSNTVLQNEENTVADTNTINETNTVQVDRVEQENPVQEPQENAEQVQPEMQQPTISETTNTPIVEEDNFRTQGFIEVNEELLYDDEEDNFIIGENYEETIKNITNYAENINWPAYILTSAKANCTQEELVEKIQKIVLDRIEKNNSFIVKMYVSHDKLVKINFEVPETQESFDVEIISKGEKEKYLKFMLLTGQRDEANGYDVSFYKKSSDSNLKNKIVINKIYKGKISQKMNINIETKGTVNSKKYTTDVGFMFSDSDGEFKTEIENSLNFDVEAEIEDLSDDNCLFMDTLSDEELSLTVDAIKEKIISVLKEKNRNLNMIDIDNSVVEQIEQTDNNMQNQEAKEEVKQVLIQTIADKMRDYLNQGKELKIQDLEDLEISNYEVSVSISSNLAIITINGYQFKLDSEFNLSD